MNPDLLPEKQIVNESKFNQMKGDYYGNTGRAGQVL
jgi:hypothetical protein